MMMDKVAKEVARCTTGKVLAKFASGVAVVAASCAMTSSAAGVPLDAGVFKDAIYWFTGAVDRNGDGYLSQTAGDEIRNTLIASDTSSSLNKAYAEGSLKGFAITQATVTNYYTGQVIENAAVLKAQPGAFTTRAEGCVFLANASEKLTVNTSYTLLMRARKESGSPYYSVFAYVGGIRFGMMDGPWISFPNGGGDKQTDGWSGDTWCDIAYVMNAEDQKAYIYTVNKSYAFAVHTIAYPDAFKTWTGGSESAYLFYSNWTGPNASLHQFAFWERALSEDEVKEAFSWPANADCCKTQVGYKNKSASEFASLGASGKFTVVSNSEPLSVYSPLLNASNPEISTTFAMDAAHAIDLTEVKEGVGAKYAPRAQEIICHFASDSGVGQLEAYVNDTLVGCEKSRPGSYVGFVAPSNIVTDTMMLTLKWKSGADIKIDAFYVSKNADWQVGYRNNSCFDDGFAPTASKYRVGDGWNTFGRSLTGLGNGAATNCVITVSLTQEQAESFSYRFTVRWGNRIGAAGYNGVRVNGKLMATQFIGWGLVDTTVTMTPEDLVVGDNTIEIFRTDPETDYGAGNYDQIDYVRFEPVKYIPKFGLALIVR